MSGVDARSLEERLSALETEKQRRGLVASSLSVVAVLVSLVTGGFTVYDRVVERPRAEMNARVEGFARTMGEIAEVTAQYAQRNATAESPAAAQAISFASAAQIRLLLVTAEQQVTGLEARVSPQQYVALAEANLNVGDFADVVRFSDAVLAREPADPMMVFAAHRMRATGLLNRSGGPDVAAVRAALDAAHAAIEGQTLFGLSVSRGDITVDRLVVEYGFGDCAAVPALVSNLSTLGAATDVSPQARDMWMARLIGTERTWPGRCPTPLALASPQPAVTEAPIVTAPAPN